MEKLSDAFELGYLYCQQGKNLEQAKADFVKLFTVAADAVTVTKCNQVCSCKHGIYIKVCFSKEKCEKQMQVTR